MDRLSTATLLFLSCAGLGFHSDLTRLFVWVMFGFRTVREGRAELGPREGHIVGASYRANTKSHKTKFDDFKNKHNILSLESSNDFNGNY